MHAAVLRFLAWGIYGWSAQWSVAFAFEVTDKVGVCGAGMPGAAGAAM